MTPAARCQSTIEILSLIDEAEAPADAVLGAWFRGHRFAGSRDRAAIQALVYAVLRHRAQLDWWCRHAAVPATARSRVVCALALARPWPDVEATAAFAPSRYGPEALDDVERRLAALASDNDLVHPDQPAAVRLNIPDWLEPSFFTAFGEAIEAELRALLPEATVDLRTNTLKIDRGALIVRLAAEGVDASPTPLSPVGLRLKRRRPLTGLAVAREGLFEPQDEGSQLAALLAGARPGDAVLDLCAGGGGKALGLAAAMENRGRLLLADIDAGRLARARPRLDRAGVSIAEIGTPDAIEGRFDVVLLDVPCSGSGVWRRNPEARWRLTPARLEALATRQRELLDSGARRLRPGGRLVYVTCSLLPQENRAQVDAFLARQDGRFGLRPMAPEWRRVTGRDLPPDSHEVLMTPARHGTDGFYVAILESTVR